MNLEGLDSCVAAVELAVSSGWWLMIRVLLALLQTEAVRRDDPRLFYMRSGSVAPRARGNRYIDFALAA